MTQLQGLFPCYACTVVFVFVSMLCAGTAWGADISHYATGLENGTTGMNKGDCGSIAESTDAPRTGAKCISTVYTGGSGAKRWYPDVTFAIPKNSYFHIIGYAKLESSDATTASTSTQAYVSAYVGGDNTYAYYGYPVADSKLLLFRYSGHKIGGYKKPPFIFSD